VQHQGLTEIFDEIITNPATWTDDGLLKIRRRIDPDGPQHNCTAGCSPNMCKGSVSAIKRTAPDPTKLLYAGQELEAFIARTGRKFDRVIYVGDGSNDFCPILRMGRFVTANKNSCTSSYMFPPAPISPTSEGTEGSNRASRRVSQAMFKLSLNLGQEPGRLRNTSKSLLPTNSLKRCHPNQPSTPVWGKLQLPIKHA